MIARALGPGIAPDVTIVDGLCYVAFGTQSPMALQLVTLTRDGQVISTRTLPHGFDQSFPRFSGAWLVYRQDEAHGFRAVARHLQTGQTWPYTAAGGTFGLTVHAALELCAYEWKTPDTPWLVWFGDLQTGLARQSNLQGAPDGIDQIISPNSVTLRKDTRGDVAGIWYPVRAGNLTVGELRDSPDRPNGGIGVQLAGDVLRVALPAQNTPNPRCAAAGDTYAIVCWGQTVQLLLASESALRALPPAGRVPGPIVNQPLEVSVSVPLSAPVVESVTRYVARFPVPQQATPGPATEPFENICRGWCWNLAEQVQFDTGDPRWGVKNAGGGRPQSKDSITFNGPRLINYDLLTGVGTGRPTLNLAVSGEDITGQVFMPVKAVNHVGGAVPDPVKPPPVVTPAPVGKSRVQVHADIRELVRFYMEPDGLNRRARGQGLDEGIADWFTLAAFDPIEDIKNQIKQFQEYKDQHK